MIALRPMPISEGGHTVTVFPGAGPDGLNACTMACSRGPDCAVNHLSPAPLAVAVLEANRHLDECAGRPILTNP